MLIKMCGFTRPGDASFAEKIGVDMVGVILVRDSPRYIPLSKAREVLSAVGGNVMKVAVVAPESVEHVKEVGSELNPDFLQIHYNTPFELISDIRKKTGFRLIGVVPVQRQGAEVSELVARAKKISELCDMVLIDTKSPYGGGTGLTHDWSISSKVRREIPAHVLLAGGLRPGNVQEAIRAVSPDGVDVASGIESAPGIKDRGLMLEFVESVERATLDEGM